MNPPRSRPTSRISSTRHLIVNTGAFSKPTSRRPATSRTRSRTAASTSTSPRGRHQHLTMPRSTAASCRTRRRAAPRTSSPRLVFWMYGRETESEIRRIYQQFAKKPEFGEANVKVFKAGYTSARPPRCSDRVQVPPAVFKRACIATSRATRRSRWGSWSAPSSPQDAVLLGLSDHARFVDPALAREVQELRNADVPGRGRDRRDGAALARRTADRSR